MRYAYFQFKIYRRRSSSRGFTLVELLVVLVIFLILVAIALPIAKGLISDQKGTRTAQNVEAFLSSARSRAIAEGRIVGVRFERLATTNYARSTCLRLRQLVGVPAYSGDAADAVATLMYIPPSPLPAPLLPASPNRQVINTATFSSADCPLLYLSSQILNDKISPTEYDASNDHLAPIQEGDLLELPGGRSFTIRSIKLDLAFPGDPTRSERGIRELVGNEVPVTFDPFEFQTVGGANSVSRFPVTLVGPVSPRPVKFRIHRSPVLSTNNVLSLPQGMAIDLNYSGIGVVGSDFAPPLAGSVRAVDILFNANGSVTQVIYDSSNNRIYPTGLIYFCVGEIDGVASLATGALDNPFSQDKLLTTNIMNTDSLWVVINPASGRVTTVPMGTVTPLSGTPPTDPADIAYKTAVEQARFFATLSDTVTE